MKQKKSILKMTLIALFCALSYLCVFIFRIKVPPFLTFDAKDSVMAIGGLILGPISALIMVVLTTFLEFITVSDTGPYGFIMNFISSVAFVMPVSLLYALRKKLKFAMIGLGVSVITMTTFMMFANLLITPYYMTGGSVEMVAEMIPTLLLPFNLIKSILNAGIVLVLYKPISESLRRIGARKFSMQDHADFRITKKTIVIMLVGILLIVASILYFILEMNATLA